MCAARRAALLLAARPVCAARHDDVWIPPRGERNMTSFACASPRDGPRQGASSTTSSSGAAPSCCTHSELQQIGVWNATVFAAAPPGRAPCRSACCRNCALFIPPEADFRRARLRQRYTDQRYTDQQGMEARGDAPMSVSVIGNSVIGDDLYAWPDPMRAVLRSRLPRTPWRVNGTAASPGLRYPGLRAPQLLGVLSPSMSNESVALWKLDQIQSAVQGLRAADIIVIHMSLLMVDGTADVVLRWLLSLPHTPFIVVVQHCKRWMLSPGVLSTKAAATQLRDAELAEYYGVPLVNLCSALHSIYAGTCVEAQPGLNQVYKSGDNLHFHRLGLRMLAELVAEMVVSAVLLPAKPRALPPLPPPLLQ
eukprot:gene46186-64493_t